MEQKSWVPLPRNFTQFQLYQSPDCVQVYLFLLLSAAKEEGMSCGLPLMRGQYRSTQRAVYDFLGLTRQRFRTAVGKLAARGYIYVEGRRKSTTWTVRYYDRVLSTCGGCWSKLYHDVLYYPWFKKPSVVLVYAHLLCSSSVDGTSSDIHVADITLFTGLSARAVTAAFRTLVHDDVITASPSPKRSTYFIGMTNGGLCLPCHPVQTGDGTSVGATNSSGSEIEVVHAEYLESDSCSGMQPQPNPNLTAPQPQPNRTPTTRGNWDKTEVVQAARSVSSSYSGIQPQHNHNTTPNDGRNGAGNSENKTKKSAFLAHARVSKLKEREKERERRTRPRGSPNPSHCHRNL